MTALAVGAPLAIQAINSDPTEYAAPGESGQASALGSPSDSVGNRMDGQNLDGRPSGIGGIEAESDSKAKGQSLSPKSAAVTEPTQVESSTTDTTVAPSSSVPETTTSIAPTTGSSASSSTSTTSGASSSSSSSTSTTAATTTSTTKVSTTSSSSTSSTSTTAATVAPTSSSAAQAATS